MLLIHDEERGARVCKGTDSISESSKYIAPGVGVALYGPACLKPQLRYRACASAIDGKESAYIVS